jgi:hypothetical protein
MQKVYMLVQLALMVGSVLASPMPGSPSLHDAFNSQTAYAYTAEI